MREGEREREREIERERERDRETRERVNHYSSILSIIMRIKVLLNIFLLALK